MTKLEFNLIVDSIVKNEVLKPKKKTMLPVQV